MSPRVKYTEKYFDKSVALSQIPVERVNGIVLECYRVLHLNRYTRPTQVNVKTNVAEWAKISFAYNTLLKLGFTSVDTVVKKGNTFWRKLRRTPKNGSLAILGCSHKYKVVANVRVMRLIPPRDNGILRYSEPFCEKIYVSGNVWYLGCTSGNPFARSSDDFKVWDEPFHSDID